MRLLHYIPFLTIQYNEFHSQPTEGPRWGPTDRQTDSGLSSFYVFTLMLVIWRRQCVWITREGRKASLVLTTVRPKHE
jgi:hypothetical protein